MISSVLFLSCLIYAVESNPALSYIKCPSGTNDCVKNAVKEMYALVLNANPAIGAEEMDPMFQKLIEGDLNVVKYKLTNTTVIGYRSCDIQKASRNSAAQTLQFEMLCQKFDLQGQYDINGEILRIKVEGNGDYSLKSGKYKLILDMQLGTVSRNGNEYANIKSFSFKADPIEPMTFNITNLFGGDKRLGERFLNFANQHWKPVTYILQDPTFRANLQKLVQNLNKYFKTMPLTSSSHRK